MTAPETLGQRLRRMRRSKGLSQADLAAPDLSPSYVSLIEAGKRMPSAEITAVLAERLDCPVELLADGVDPNVAREIELDMRYAELALQSGEAREAVHRFRVILDLPTDVIADSLRAQARENYARALEATGDIEAALAEYETVRQEATQAGDGVSWLRTTIALCRCWREVGDLSHSVEVGLAASRELDDRDLDGSDLAVELSASLLFSYYERGDVTTARRLAERTLEAAEKLGTRRARGAAYWNASIVAHGSNRPTEALALAERAVAMFADGEDQRSVARLRSAYGALLLRQDPPDAARALSLLTAAAHQLAEWSSEIDVAYCETEVARAHLVLGHVDNAVEAAEQALFRLGASKRLETPRARAVLAAARWSAGDAKGAVTAYRQAARELAAAGASRQAAAIWRELGELLTTMGRRDDALEAYRHTADLAGVPAPTAVAVRVVTR